MATNSPGAFSWQTKMVDLGSDVQCIIKWTDGLRGTSCSLKKCPFKKRQRSCFSYNAPGLQKLREKESQWELKVPSHFIVLDFYDITILIGKQSLACKTCVHMIASDRICMNWILFGFYHQWRFVLTWLVGSWPWRKPLSWHPALSSASLSSSPVS